MCASAWPTAMVLAHTCWPARWATASWCDCNFRKTRTASVMRVLIVDDEPLARARLAALLGECADVEIAGSVSDGEAALVALGELHPDVLAARHQHARHERHRAGPAAGGPITTAGGVLHGLRKPRIACIRPGCGRLLAQAGAPGAPERGHATRATAPGAGAARNDQLSAWAPGWRTGAHRAGRRDLSAGRGKVRGRAASRRPAADWRNPCASWRMPTPTS